MLQETYVVGCGSVYPALLRCAPHKAVVIKQARTDGGQNAIHNGRSYTVNESTTVPAKRKFQRSFPNLENRANSRVGPAKMKAVRRSPNTPASRRGQLPGSIPPSGFSI